MSNSNPSTAQNGTSGIFQLFKNAYSGHPKEIWAIVILTVINRMGTMVIPFLSIYLTTQLHFSLKEAGILASAFGFGSFGGSYLGGKFSDQIGAKKVIIASLFFSGLMFIGLQWVTTFNSLFLFIFITSLFGDAYRPASMTAIGDYVPKAQTGRTMAFYRLAINLGMTAAPLFGGFIAVQYGYKWLFWIDGVTCILGATYFWWTSRNWKSIKHEAQEISTTIISKPALPPSKNKHFILFLFSSFLIGFVFIQWFHTVPVFIKTVWGFDERYIGLMMALSSFLIVIIEMPLIDYIEKKAKMMRFMLVGILLVGISFLTFLLPAALVLCFVAVIILTFGEILFLPFNNSIPVYMSGNSNRGAYTAWYWMTWSLVMISAPLVGFWFIEVFSFQAFWWFIFGIGLISWAITTRLGNRIFED